MLGGGSTISMTIAGEAIRLALSAKAGANWLSRIEPDGRVSMDATDMDYL